MDQVKNHLFLKIPFKKRKKQRHSKTSNTFTETLTKAKSSTFSYGGDKQNDWN